ncbi:SAM-dependent methyltransferase [Streptomyces sp. NPDC058770]|uniref:SAM-dependent methyltransferase n=1 Tax=Streptomyces sp. NPDC058770 TaxID=3346631 RepID=UPI0036AB8272
MNTLTAPVSTTSPAETPMGSHVPLTASSARLTQWLLGSRHHHHPADRILGQRLLRAAPWVGQAVELNHLYAHQTVSMLRECGIRQFVDLGSGLPSDNPRFPSTAVSAGPDSTVIHVDADPYVIEHGPQLLETPARHRFVHADLRRDMLRVLRDLPLHGLDPGRPTALLFHNVLPWINDDADAHAIVGAALDQAPPGSVLSLTHLTADLRRTGSAAAALCLDTAGLPVSLRTAEQIRDLIEDQPHPWRVRAPGIVPVGLYHPRQCSAPVPIGDSGAYAVIAIHPQPAHR